MYFQVIPSRIPLDSEDEPSRHSTFGRVTSPLPELLRELPCQSFLAGLLWTYGASLRAGARRDLAGRPSTSTATRISGRRAATVTDTMMITGLKSTLPQQLVSVDRRPRNDAFQGKLRACAMTYLSTVEQK